MREILLRFLPFWLFLLFFKFAGSLHYTLLAPFGQSLMPLWIVGLLVGGESLVQVFLDVPAGYLLDRFGYRRLLKYTTAFFMVAASCIVLGLTPLTYVLTIFFSIFGWIFFVPGMNAYILSHATEAEAGRFFSLKDTSNSVGVVLASVSLPFVLIMPVQTAGVLLLCLLGLAFVFVSGSPEDKKVQVPAVPVRRARRHSSLRMLWLGINRLNPASGMLVLLTFAANIFYSMIWFVVPLVIAMSQANTGLLSLGLAVFDFSIVVLGYIIGTLADKGNKRTFVFFGLLLFALCGMAVGFNFGILFILFGFLATAGDEMAGISLWSWLHHLDHAHDSDGAVSGVITLFDDLGYAFGPMLAGVLYILVGPGWTITLGALPIFIVWLLYYMLVHSKAPVDALYANAPRKPHRFRHKS